MAKRSDGRFIVSYSEIKTWHECPHRWRAFYELGARDIPELNSPSQALAWGSSFHDALEQHLLGKPGMFPEFWQKEIDALSEAGAPLDEAFKANVEKNSEPLIAGMEEWLTTNLGAGWILLGTEVQFELHLDDLANLLGVKNTCDAWLKGFIDLVGMDAKGKIWLLDWKTTEKGWSFWKRKDENTPRQIQLYKACVMAGMQKAGATVNLKGHSRICGTEYVIIRPHMQTEKLTNPERFPVPSGPKSMERTFKWAQQAVMGMLMGIQRQDENGCRFCPLAGVTEWCDKPQTTRQGWAG